MQASFFIGPLLGDAAFAVPFLTPEERKIVQIQAAL